MTQNFRATFARQAGASGKYHGFDPSRLLVERLSSNGYVRVYELAVDPDGREHWKYVEGEYKTRALERIVVGEYQEEVAL